jgi:uncharacterized protein (DUF4415 family)
MPMPGASTSESVLMPAKKRSIGKATKIGRPPSDNPKVLVTLRLDADVVAHFRAGGPGWQTRANAALRKAARLPSVPQ